MIIAATFLRLKGMSKRQNMEKAKKIIKQAKDKGAKIVILPSMFPFGDVLDLYDNDRKLKSIVKNYSEKIRGTASDMIASLALEGELHIISGPILEQAGPKVFLTTIVVSPQGEIIGKYRKLAPSERDITLGLSAGKEPVVISLDKKYGLAAEDDLLMPEINRILAINGAESVLASSRPTREKHDKVKYVTIARAVENGMPYIVSGQAVEDENGEEILKSPSFIVSSDGDVVREASEEDSIVSIDSSVLFRTKEVSKNPMLETIVSGLYKSVKKSRNGMRAES